ncbi:hypothetical protein QJS04_geneDACA000867 [Acorus gramineus]|uniref:Uncharacterized protein n=1 Tax=Acorus gramineus TaxID=55184 RepID=A0AAV9BIV1_ACOGR|nr:hypothetical protein QJS04_geneDACA000867 [Acorus gramineus]
MEAEEKEMERLKMEKDEVYFKGLGFHDNSYFAMEKSWMFIRDRRSNEFQTLKGYQVIGGYMPPMNDSYEKKVIDEVSKEHAGRMNIYGVEAIYGLLISVEFEENARQQEHARQQRKLCIRSNKGESIHAFKESGIPLQREFEELKRNILLKSGDLNQNMKK